MTALRRLGQAVGAAVVATFTEPAFNYSAAFDLIWEEVSIPVGYADRRRAEETVVEEAVNISTSEEAAGSWRMVRSRLTSIWRRTSPSDTSPRPPWTSNRWSA